MAPGQNEGRPCPTCAGSGRISPDAAGGLDMRQLIAAGELVYPPKPDPITLTREQYESLLINGNAITKR